MSTVLLLMAVLLDSVVVAGCVPLVVLAWCSRGSPAVLHAGQTAGPLPSSGRCQVRRWLPGIACMTVARSFQGRRGEAGAENPPPRPPPPPGGGGGGGPYPGAPLPCAPDLERFF